MSELIKLAVVDDNEYFREGLVSYFKGLKNFQVEIEAKHGRELIDKLNAGKTPDSILGINNLLAPGTSRGGMNAYDDEWFTDPANHILPEVKNAVNNYINGK